MAVASQNGRWRAPPAKMAAVANLVPNHIAANAVPQKNNFSIDFFYLQFKNRYV